MNPTFVLFASIMLTGSMSFSQVKAFKPIERVKPVEKVTETVLKGKDPVKVEVTTNQKGMSTEETSKSILTAELNKIFSDLQGSRTKIDSIIMGAANVAANEPETAAWIAVTLANLKTDSAVGIKTSTLKRMKAQLAKNIIEMQLKRIEAKNKGQVIARVSKDQDAINFMAQKILSIAKEDELAGTNALKILQKASENYDATQTFTENFVSQTVEQLLKNDTKLTRAEAKERAEKLLKTCLN